MIPEMNYDPFIVQGGRILVVVKKSIVIGWKRSIRAFDGNKWQNI